MAEAGNLQASVLQRVGGQDARPASVGDDADAVALQKRLVGKGAGVVKERFHRSSAGDARLAEGRLVCRLGAGQAARVRRNRPRA